MNSGGSFIAKRPVDCIKSGYTREIVAYACGDRSETIRQHHPVGKETG